MLILHIQVSIYCLLPFHGSYTWYTNQYKDSMFISVCVTQQGNGSLSLIRVNMDSVLDGFSCQGRKTDRFSSTIKTDCDAGGNSVYKMERKTLVKMEEVIPELLKEMGWQTIHVICDEPCGELSKGSQLTLLTDWSYWWSVVMCP